MKKLTSLLLSLVLMVSVLACGASAKTSKKVRIAGLKGPTTMGLVNLLSMEKDGTASLDYDLQLYGAADEIVPKLIKGELDMAAIPANLAATLYQKTKGGIQVMAVNTLGVLYVVGNNLYEVFKNAYRVLKPMRYLSLTFNNKDICSWLALLFSILKSGFTFDRMYFQDGVKNYRQTAHTKAKGSPYGDFIYTFKKVDSIPVKVYTTEEDFIYDIDNIFLKDISCSDENRNEMILQMFVDAIPLIDAFAKTYLRTKGIHHLYSHFNKKYLSKLYDTDNANK